MTDSTFTDLKRRYAKTGTGRTLERSVERYFTREVRSLGWIVSKFGDLSRRGAPDRIIIGPARGVVAFVELKSPSGRLRADQVAYHDDLRARGIRVYVLRTLEDVDTFTSALRLGLLGPE